MWLVKDSDGITVKICYSQTDAQAFIDRHTHWTPGPLTLSWVEMP
jgi:hypothetical protein